MQDRSRTVQAPISSRFVLILLVVCFACSRQVMADPPASYTSTSPIVPGVYGTNTANGDAVFGNATMGRGVVGASEGGIGVHGHSRDGRAAALLGSATPRLELKGRARAMVECGEKPRRRLGQEENFITTAAGI